MKKLFYLVLLVAVVATIAMLPEVQDSMVHAFANSDSHTLLMAGPGFAAMKYSSGQNNMGGFKDRVLFIPADAVTAVPKLPAVLTSNDDLVTATGSFTFAVGGIASPIYIYCSPKTVKYDADSQGEDDGISFAPVGEFFYPGNSKAMHAFNALIKNTPGYIILEDANGQQMLVGQPGLLAYIKPSFSGGQKRADLRGTKYTFSADSNTTAIFLGTPIDIDALAGLITVAG